ncbi:MAG: hypothetical protein K8R87_08130 [Verrucomicrobia bacterium]|nr:hypothetical protein [Verrucomicrobiota bacterium]
MNTPNTAKSAQICASRQPKKTHLVACFFGILLIAVALLRFVPWSGIDPFGLKKQLSETQQRATDKAKLQAEHERLVKLNAAKKQIGSLTDDAYARMMQTINEARSKVARIKKAQDDRLPNLTAGISAYLQGYSNAMGLTWKMAVDKVRGTHKTQDYLAVAFRPAIQSLAKADAELLQVLTDCEYELSMIKANLLASTAQVLDTADFKAVELGLEDNLRKLTWISQPQPSPWEARFGRAGMFIGPSTN